jgi:hypothetical protein
LIRWATASLSKGAGQIQGRPKAALNLGLTVLLFDRRPGAGRFDLGRVRRYRSRRK